MILTFNALAGVRRLLEAIAQQTRPPDTILVVDNNSDDGSHEYLTQRSKESSRLVVLRTDENLGPAGGFKVGIGWAYDEGFDHLWLLDDDSVPEANCLEMLLQQLGSRVDAIAWPKNLDERHRETAFPAWRGELLPRQAVDRGGLPNPDFFWGQEDTEYLQWRLERECQMEFLKVPQAVVHYTDTNPRKRSSWHYYYLPRNTIYYRLWVQRGPSRPKQLWKLFRSLVKFWLKILLIESEKLKKARFMLLGTWHGLRRRLGKTIDPARS